jgi:hypothetical protein
MKRIKNLALIAALTALGSVSSFASVVTLTFEGLGDEASIGNYYNGGAGGNLGIQFGPDSLSLISDTAGGTGNFANAPSGSTIAFFLSGPGDVMNVTAGFDTGFSFYYAGSITGSVGVFSGLDGTGTLLASLSLPPTPNPNTVWAPVGITFAGTAQSVVFSGAADYIGFDNITLGSETPGAAAPDGGSSALLLTVGLLGLAGFARRRKVASH